MSASDDPSLLQEPEDPQDAVLDAVLDAGLDAVLDADDSLTSLALAEASSAPLQALNPQDLAALENRRRLVKVLQLWQPSLPSASDWLAQSDRLKARCEVDQAAAQLALEESLSPILLLADPPPPAPDQWQRLEARISSRVSESKLTPRTASRVSSLSRLALAILLMACGALLAHSLPPSTADFPQVDGWLKEARQAIDENDFHKAESFLEQVLARGGANPDCHSRLAEALSELEALKLFVEPRQSPDRQGALRRLIYRYPAARVSALALLELRDRSRPSPSETASVSLPIEAFKPGLESPRQVLAYEARRKVFLTILKDASDQSLADAAKLQLARLDFEHGEHHEARRWLDGIEGQSWAALQARELAEVWSKREDSRLR